MAAPNARFVNGDRGSQGGPPLVGKWLQRNLDSVVVRSVRERSVLSCLVEGSRKLADRYRARVNEEKPTERLANVLSSVANAYLALASQLDLLEAVESQESARIASREISKQ